MGEWTVQWDYASSIGGPWSAGEVVTLDEETAAHVNRSSPGVLVRKPAAGDGPPHDRMVKAARKRGVSDGE